MVAKNPLFSFTKEEAAFLREGQAEAQKALSPVATRDSEALYEHPDMVDDDDALLRSAFTRDVDRILNNAFYNRCMDKTQVFPFYRNDDLTRRSFHLQLVAHISRKISSALRLNGALTEAIALGHDMGHTPFGHGGERVLSDLYHARTGRYFNHNVHSVRLLRTIAGRNLSLQTLNGILCHCGEKAFARYEPAACDTFVELDTLMEKCSTEAGASQTLRPSTLEGCVVRICDMLAYLGKDRQDALTVKVFSDDDYPLSDSVIGATNREIIHNVSVNLIKNSMGHNYLSLDDEVFSSLVEAKERNAREIYASPAAHERLDQLIAPMMKRLYEQCIDDLKAGREESPIFRHHLNAWMMRNRDDYHNEETDDDKVVDYLASMTDEYFIALYNYLYPREAVSEEDLYIPYFSH